MEDRKLIKPKQASKLLGVSPQTLIDWEKKGFLKSVKTFGGHRRFFEKEIMEILNEEVKNKESE